MAGRELSSGQRVELTSAQRRAVEATNYPPNEVAQAVRKHNARIMHAKGDRIVSVLDDKFWGNKDDSPPSSRGHNGSGGRERIFCAAIVYFELLDEAQTARTMVFIEEVVKKIGELIRAWTYYELPISKVPAIANTTFLKERD